MLEIKNLHAFYDSSHILHDVSINIGQGEIFCILGRNGVGKTTLLKSLLGLSVRTEGEINIGGEELSHLETYERARRGIAYVPQGREIVPGLTVLENIRLGCFARRDRKMAIPDYIWSMFPFLREHLNRRGTNLSGGQQQQLAIARALAAGPSILLMDEPTEGIQPNVVQEIERTIVRLNQEFGLTIILVEQKVQFARTSGHRFAFLEKGRVAATGVAGDLSDALLHKYMAV
jgi:urea transport system ATP-binding protein